VTSLLFILFILVLFNEVSSASDYTALTYMIMSELERTWKEVAVS
jgi:hypothetical protein